MNKTRNPWPTNFPSSEESPVSAKFACTLQESPDSEADYILTSKFK